MNSAKKYNKIKLTITIIETILSFAFLLVLSFTNLKFSIEEYSFLLFSNDYLALIAFVLLISLASGILLFPFSIYGEFILEHKYKLSNQTLLKYFFEKAKGILISLIIGIPILLIFYYVLKNYPDEWWIILFFVLFIFSVLIARLAPVLIFPLFYKFTPVDNQELEEQIIDLCEKVRFYFTGIYTFNLSKNTKKANAAFAGLGRSKRIILSDTLIENFTNDEIGTVLAHELGHYKEKHIMKNILINSAILFISLYIASELFLTLTVSLGIYELHKLSALPILFLIIMILNLLTSPISNYISRRFEYQADRYAVDLTYLPDVFINTLNKLSELNLADKTPNKLIEFFFYSHPSIENRKKAIIERYGENK